MNKYRGFCNYFNRWVYGVYPFISSEVDHSNTLNMSTFWLRVCDGYIDPDSIGRYIDRKDQHGVEIYEGDIVEAKEGLGRSVGEIPKSSLPEGSNEWLWEVWRLPGAMDHCFNPLVIGNMYQNPDLLEK